MRAQRQQSFITREPPEGSSPQKLGAHCAGTLALIGVVACSGGRPLGPGSTSFAFAGVPEGLEVQRVVVWVDGRSVYDVRDEVEPAEVTRLALRPGSHRVELMLRMKNPVKPECSIDVGVSHMIEVDKRAAGLRFKVEDRGADLAPLERYELKADVEGATLANANDKPRDYAHCHELAPLEQATCVTTEYLDEARRAKDIVSVNCLNDILLRLQRLRSDPSHANQMAQIEQLLIDAQGCNTRASPTYSEFIFTGHREYC